jgi:hypothetical protein
MPLITIASVDIAGWQGNASGISLRIYANQSFTAQSGDIIPRSVLANPASLGTFFKSVACTVASGVLTIPAVTLDSTVDSTDNPDATYSAVFWDGTSNLPIQTFGHRGQFPVPVSPTPTTWAALFATEANQ